MGPTRFIPVILTLLALVGNAFALFQDEAGVLDWHKKLLGTPLNAHFATIGDRERVFVATSRDVVASINADTGAILWRHAIPRGEKIVGFAGLNHWGIASLMRSGDAYRVRTWDPDSGNLRWDVSIGEAKPADGGSRISFTASGDLLVGAGSTTVKLDRKSGSKMWAFVSDANTASLPEVWHVGSEVLISLRASKMSGEATVIVLQRSLADGKVIVEYELADAKVDLSQMPLDKLVQVVEHQNVSFLFIRTPGSGQSPILSHKIGSREIVEQTQAIPMGGPRGLHFEGGPSRPFGRVLVRLTDGGLLTLSIDDKDGKLKPTTQFDSRSKPMIIDTRIAAETDNHVCLTYARPWKTTLTFEAIDLSNNKVVPVTFPHSSRTTGFPVKTFIGRSQSRGAQSYRFLTVFEDGSVHLFDERGPVWKREESLADVADAVFIEFAEEKLLVQDFAEREPSQSALGVYVHRLRLHAKKVLGLFARSSTAGPALDHAQDKQIFRDLFGMRKLILFLSKRGKLVALESERGTTVWERYIAMEAVDAGKVSGEAVVEGGELLVVRTTAEQYPAVVMVKLTVNTLDGKSATIMHMINAMDGTDFGRDPMTIFETEIASTMELPIVVGEEQIHPVVAIDANKRLRIVPESATIASTFLGFAPRISFFVGEVGGSCITGFRVDVGASASRAIQSWKLDFPAGERVVAIGKKPAYERVASIGRVRGDRSVLYKYLNPHLAVFGTVREDPNVFSVYVVDVTKGSVLYHAAHSGGGMKTAADPSIHIAQAEHWIVYSFWNTGTSDMSNAAVAAKTDFGAGGDGGKKKKKKKASRRKPPVSKGQEIVALELYESGQPDSKLSPNSSQVLVRPFVLSQAYQLQTAVDALGITTTRSGITTREALVITPAGQLFAISRRLLDPRRPVGAPSADDKEEGLIPYHSAILFNPKEVASYSDHVLGADRIKTAPAFLESTSLVLAFGLDVFFTRRMPSKAFDVLSADFSRGSLIATTLALVVAIVVARRMGDQKRVKDAFAS